MNKLTSLEPTRLWHYFQEICQIPRPSKKEEKIAAYLISFGKEHGFETVADETGKTPGGHIAYKISCTGLKGGHSGDDINKNLGNAVKILNRFLWNATRDLELRISSLDAGNLRNAIAREGFAVVTIPATRKKDIEKYVVEFHTTVSNEIRTTEPGFLFSAESCPLPGMIIPAGLQQTLLNALYACPHGVIQMSRDIKDFVETSTNLASVKFSDNRILVTTSQRSSVESSKKDASDMVGSLLRLAGFTVEHSAGYPGWKPDPGSEILRITVESYRRLFTEEPQVLAIHAGLECGLIGAIYPGMDMVSFGPTIKGAHSPDERLHIPSVVKFWDLMVDIMMNIPSVYI